MYEQDFEYNVSLSLNALNCWESKSYCGSEICWIILRGHFLFTLFNSPFFLLRDAFSFGLVLQLVDSFISVERFRLESRGVSLNFGMTKYAKVSSATELAKSWQGWWLRDRKTSRKIATQTWITEMPQGVELPAAFLNAFICSPRRTRRRNETHARVFSFSSIRGRLFVAVCCAIPSLFPFSFFC